MKFRCSIGIFLSSAHLICRITDISECFRGSFQLRDNESRLYIIFNVKKKIILNYTNLLLEEHFFSLRIFQIKKGGNVKMTGLSLKIIIPEKKITLNQLLQLCTARTAWSDSVIRSETSLITESDRGGPIRLLSLFRSFSVNVLP